MVAYVFDNLGAWTWITLGILLMGLELVVPGGFMIWLGLAAMATGLFVGLFGIAWQGAMLLFVAVAVGFVYLGRWLTRSRPAESADTQPNLSERGRAMIGRTFRLHAPITEGEGRVRVDDSSWRITGPDLPAGAQVTVVRVEGSTLVVREAPPQS